MLERVFVWAHVLTILAFLVYLPRSKHLHIAAAAINVWFGRTGPGGRLEPLGFDDPEIPEEDIRFGAGTAADITWKQVLDTFSCTECGRCQDACPAFATGKVLSPKLLIMGLRDQVFSDGATIVKARGGDGVGDAAAGPLADLARAQRGARGVGLGLRHLRGVRTGVPGLDRTRRPHGRFASSPGDGRVELPVRGRPMLRDVERASNPWGKAQSERADWAAGLGVRVLQPGDPAPEYLYWVGCASSFDERARKTAESTAKLLQRAGVDFAILGPREACTGDPARRMGNEYAFQAFAGRTSRP